MQLTISVEGVTSVVVDADDLVEACLIATGLLATAGQGFAELSKLAVSSDTSALSTPTELEDLQSEAAHAAALAVAESRLVPRAQALQSPDGGVVVTRWTRTSVPVCELDGDLLRATTTGWEFDTLNDGIVPFNYLDLNAGVYGDVDGDTHELSGDMRAVWEAFRPGCNVVEATTAPMSACVLPAMQKLGEMTSTALAVAAPLVMAHDTPPTTEWVPVP
jgi:hypothetical protein